MKKMRFGFILIAVVMLASMFGGCGGKDNRTKVELVDYMPLYKYHEPLNMKVGQYVAASYPKGMSASDNGAYDLMKEVMNIEVEAKFTATWGSAYFENVNYSILSNDIPDLFQVFATQYFELIKNDMIWDLTDLIEQYGSDKLKHVLKYCTVDLDDKDPSRENLLVNVSSKNGRMYGLPWITSAFTGLPLMYIRKDLREEMGEEVPTSADEVLSLAEKMTNKYATPSKNFYGMDFYNSPQAVYQMYGAYPQIYDKNAQGEYVYGSHDPKVLQVVKKLNDLYAKKVINQDYGANEGAGAAGWDPIASGQVGIAFGEFWHCMGGIQTVMQNDPTAEWEVYKIPGVEKGSTAVPYIKPNNQGWFVVSKQFKNPEALIIIFNHIVEGWFLDGQDAEFTKKTTQLSVDYYGSVNWFPVRTDCPDVPKSKENALSEAYEKKDPTGLTNAQLVDYEAGMKYIEGGDMNYWYLPLVYSRTIPLSREYTTLKHSAHEELETRFMMEKAAFIANLETEFFAKAIRGSWDKSAYPTLDDYFNYFVGEQKRVGMQDVLNDLNDK